MVINELKLFENQFTNLTDTIVLFIKLIWLFSIHCIQCNQSKSCFYKRTMTKRSFLLIRNQVNNFH